MNEMSRALYDSDATTLSRVMKIGVAAVGAFGLVSEAAQGVIDAAYGESYIDNCIDASAAVTLMVAGYLVFKKIEDKYSKRLIDAKSRQQG